jgi:hypothetical protein
MPIEHRVNGAFGWNGNAGKPADQPFANFASTPAGVLLFHVQDVVFHLERKLIGVSIGPTASVRQALNTALLIAVEDLIARLARDAELAAELGHRFAGYPSSHKLQPFVHHRTLLPRHQPLPKWEEL